MEFRHIEYFLAVCAYPSITQAAQSLFISQQALSRCIQGLEDELGCRLFQRTAQGIRLTEEGRYLYEQFQPIMERYLRTVDEVKAHLQGDQTIPFAAAPWVLSMFYPGALYDFQEQHPAVRINAQELSDSGVITYVLSDPSHLGILAKPEQWDDERLQFLPIRTHQLHLCVHKDDPLAQQERVAFAELWDHRFLMLDKGSLYQKIIEEKARQCGFTPKISFESADVHQLCSLVDTGRGVFIAVTVQAHGMFPNLRTVPFSDPDMRLSICLICQGAEQLAPQTRQFVAFLQALS